jgi:hypothetical protein
LVVCCSIPFGCIQVEAKELKTGKALGFREESTHSSCSGLEGTATGGINFDDGYDQGYIYAHVHFSKNIDFDSNPGNKHVQNTIQDMSEDIMMDGKMLKMEYKTPSAKLDV